MVRRFLLLNGLAILGVILFHASGWGFTALFAWQGRYLAAGAAADPMGSTNYYALRVIEQLVVATIPAFLFVSGYFVAVAAGRTQATIKWGIVASRIKYLLIPYLVWSGAVLSLRFLEHGGFSPLEYLVILATGGANPAYYYVILLIQFYLLSPFLVPLARERPVLLLVGAGIAQVTVLILQYPVLLGLEVASLGPIIDIVPKWLFPARIFWFSCGVVAGFHLKTVKAWTFRFRWVLLAVLIFSFLGGILEWEAYVRMAGVDWLNHRETFLDVIYSATALLCFIAFEGLAIPFPNRLGDLGSKSFGIYLAHSPVMEYLARGLYHLVPAILATQILFQPVLIIGGLTIPLIAMALLARSPARRFYQYIFG